MIIACHKCGAKNRIPDPPDRTKAYRCGKCNTRLLGTTSTGGGSAIKTYILEAKWMHVVIPLVVLTLYFYSFSLLLAWLFPPEYGPNVNAVFVNSAWVYSLVLTAGLFLVFFALFKIGKGNKLTFGKSKEKLCVSDFILILLPLTPVVQYILNNQDILSPLGSLYVSAVFVVFSILYIIVIPILLGKFGSTKTFMILGLAFTFTITSMASLSAEFSWFERGSLVIQLVLFSAIFLVGWILYNLIGRKFMYFVVAIFFIANSATQLATEDWAKIAPSSTDTDNKLVELVGSRKPLSTPNIYLLIYDSYVINETMLEHGIDNSAQEKYLEALGFELYPHTYSVASASTGTMSRALNASTEFYGSARRGVSGDGIVQNLLGSFGYETYGIFPYNYYFQGIGSSYDFSFPSPEASASYELLIKSIFMGEFKSAGAIEFDQPSREQFVEHKLGSFESVPNKPRFVYMHDRLPGHSQNSGACRPNETALWRERLIRANREMKQDIETITHKDPGAIIVVAGDHGPYLTKNCTITGRDYNISEISRLDIQDRFGTFLAIKWPAEDFSEYDDITVLQDIFPAIFAYLFEDDRLLEVKVASTTLSNAGISGASVHNGIIYGGINDGEPLFVDRR